MHYHAHIYWQNEDQRREALSLRQPLVTLGCRLGTIHEDAIGPHPHAMYQVNYTSDNAKEVETLLYKAKLHILLHEDTGDDLRDHTKGARWIGRPLDLNIKWLEEYARMKNA